MSPDSLRTFSPQALKSARVFTMKYDQDYLGTITENYTHLWQIMSDKKCIFRFFGCIMFSRMIKCSNLGVIKQLAIVKRGIQVCQSTRCFWNMHYKNEPLVRQKSYRRKRVRKGWAKPLLYSQVNSDNYRFIRQQLFLMLHIFQELQMTLWRTGCSPEMYTEHSWDVQTWKLSCPLPWMLTWLVFLCAFYWSGSCVTNGLASQPPWKCHAGVNKNTRCMFYKELQLALNYSGFHLGQPSLVLWVSMDEQEDQEMIQWASEFPSSWTWQPQTYLFTLPLSHTLHSKLLCNLRVLTISDLNSFSPLISDESC